MKPDEDMPLNDMLRLGLEKHINLLKDISSRASKEFALEKVSIILRQMRVSLMIIVNPLVGRSTILSPAESVTDGQSDKFVVLD